jgi:hypothetical protein
MTSPLRPSPTETPPDDTALLLTYLQTHDAPCPLCKYNLRNLSTPRCPECGRPLKLTVGLVEQNIRWFILLLISVLLPTGMGLIGWLAVLRTGLEIYNHAGSIEVLALIGFQLSIFPAFAAIILRRKFLRLNDNAQKVIAGISVLEPLILYGVLFSQLLR